MNSLVKKLVRQVREDPPCPREGCNLPAGSCSVCLKKASPEHKRRFYRYIKPDNPCPYYGCNKEAGTCNDCFRLKPVQEPTPEPKAPVSDNPEPVRISAKEWKKLHGS